MNARERVKQYTRYSDGGYHRSGIVDENNCCVRTLALALKLSYDKAYSICQEAGRKHGDGFWMYRIINLLRKEYQINTYKSGMTVNKLIQMQNLGRYIVVIDQHTFPVLDGYIYDIGDIAPRSRIIRLWQVHLANPR